MNLRSTSGSAPLVRSILICRSCPEAEHVVDVDLVVGHLSSAMNADHWSAAAAD